MESQEKIFGKHRVITNTSLHLMDQKNMISNIALIVAAKSRLFTARNKMGVNSVKSTTKGLGLGLNSQHAPRYHRQYIRQGRVYMGNRHGEVNLWVPIQAKQEVATALMFLAKGRRNMAKKHLDLALDTRGIDDMGQRATIAVVIEGLQDGMGAEEAITRLGSVL